MSRDRTPLAGLILPGLDSSLEVEMLLSSIYERGSWHRRRVLYWVGEDGRTNVNEVGGGGELGRSGQVNVRRDE